MTEVLGHIFIKELKICQTTVQLQITKIYFFLGKSAAAEEFFVPFVVNFFCSFAAL